MGHLSQTSNIKQTLIVYKVPPGDIFDDNYGRAHLESSNQVRSNIQLPLSYEIFFKNLKININKFSEYLDEGGHKVAKYIVSRAMKPEAVFFS